MKPKEEIKQWLLENAVNEYGFVDLSYIDFGELTADFSGVKAKYIYNNAQETNNIYNNSQKATNYFNTHNAVIDGIQYEIDITDGIYIIVHKKGTYNGVTFIKGETIIGDTLYLYKNNLVSYHADTKQAAKDGFKRKLNQQPQISDDVQEVMFTSEVVLQVLDTEIFYVIELGNNLWFTGTMKESLEFDTHRTMVINSANVYKNESTAQIISENIIKAGKFKNAKVVPYCLKPKQHIQTQASEIDIWKHNTYQMSDNYNKFVEKKYIPLQSQLNAIREVFKEDYTPNQVCIEILQILGDNKGVKE